LGNEKIGYERREQKIILKCDTFPEETKQMQRIAHFTEKETRE